MSNADIAEKLALSVEEMAIMLGISRNLAYGLIKTPNFPAIKLNKKRIIIPVEALKNYLNNNTSKF